jgi:hypothetical protein
MYKKYDFFFVINSYMRCYILPTFYQETKMVTKLDPLHFMLVQDVNAVQFNNSHREVPPPTNRP